MIKNVQVSVIFATYNRADIIERVLQKWLEVDKNTNYVYEIICSDDESSDNTVEIIKNFIGLPITILENSHGGASRARNAALEIARGEIVIFTGDDIFPEKDFINRHYENYLKFGDKVCTLGRIEWHEELKLNHLMQHITNIGCEQFGFAGLPPYAYADFRHFYTSNISVSRKELNALDKYFDLTFDRYGFEDVEMGYRLSKNGVKIYYDADTLAYHYHIYNDVDRFCNRQMSAGNQLVVFLNLHKEVRFNKALGIEDFLEWIEMYRSSTTHRKSDWGQRILESIGKLKERTRKLETLIEKEDKNEDRAECSALYSFIFQFYLYYGLGLRIMEDTDIDDSVVAEAVVDYMFPEGSSSLYIPIKEDYSEENVKHYERTGIHTKIECDITGITEIRVDPYDKSCTVENFQASVCDERGRSSILQLRATNGAPQDPFRFYHNADPWILLFGMAKKRKYHLLVEMDVYSCVDVEVELEDRIRQMQECGKDFKASVYQPRRIDICLGRRAGKQEKEIIEKYRELIDVLYQGRVQILDEIIEHDFVGTYVYDVPIGKSFLPPEDFLNVLKIIYEFEYDGVKADENTIIYLSCLTNDAKLQLKQYRKAGLL